MDLRSRISVRAVAALPSWKLMLMLMLMLGAASPAHAQQQKIRFTGLPGYGTILTFGAGEHLQFADDGHRYLVMLSCDGKGFLRVDTQTGAVDFHIAVGYNGGCDTQDFPIPADSNIYMVGDHNNTVYGITKAANGDILCQPAPYRMIYPAGCPIPNGTLPGPNDGRIRYSGSSGVFLRDGDPELGTAFAPATGWSIDTDPPSGLNHYVITGTTTDPTAPPIASASAVNLSAAGRTDKTNYMGDKWQLTDTSVTSTLSPLDLIEWDFNVIGGLVFFDWVLKPYVPPYSVVTGYFPCEPSAVPPGDIPSGTNCYSSLGSPPITANYYFGMRTHNAGQANKWSDIGPPPAPAFVSPAISVALPQVNIAGLSGGVLRVLSGGAIADASGSQGNISESVFGWTFLPGNQTSASQKPTIPTLATGFTLTILYPGGYVASAAGSIQQVDLVPAFSLAPNPVLNGGQLTLTNQMQKGGTTVLSSVTYAIKQGATVVSSGTLAASFLPVNGTASVTAPGSTNSYTVELTYNFSVPPGPNQSLPTSQPFSTTTFTPRPALDVYIDLHNNLAPGFTSFNLTTGNTYYLYDDEILPNGVTHPGTQFYWSSDGNPSVSPGDISLGTSSGFGPVSYQPSATCSTCYLKASVPAVAGTVSATRISISNAGPPPTPTPTSGLSVSLVGQAAGTTGTPVMFTAAASGGSGTYNYSWDWGASPFPTFVAGPATNTHVYLSVGTYTITVHVSDGTSNGTATGFVTIAQGGPPPPSAAATVTGAPANPLTGTYTAEAGNTITFAAQEIPANVAGTNGYTWDFADGSPKNGQQVTYSFTGTGARSVSLTVTGDGVNRAGTASSVVHFNIVVPSFQAMLVPSAEHSAVLTDPNGILKFWATDVSVANPGSATLTISPAFLSFTATQGLTFDLASIAFDPARKVTIPAGGQQSWVDIVKILAGDVANKGTLVLKYEGSNATPLVTARVYFAPAADPLGPASGSALPSFRATSDGQVVTQGAQAAVEQDLPGLRGDESYYFRLTLFNSASTGGTFRVSAVDDRGVPVSILDPKTGAPASGGGLDFSIGPYGAIDWSNDSLGLNDPARRYVLKAHRTSSTGRLVASAAVRDRLTRDQVLVTSDAPPVFQENCAGSPGACVNYVVPGASRFQSGTGARWRTGLSIYNPSQTPRGIGLEYRYQDTSLVNPERIATGIWEFVPPGKLLFWDDVVAQVFGAADATLADPANGTAGVLTIQHFADGETTTSPLIIAVRNYDDQPTGTVGSQLAVYTEPLSIGPNEPSLLLAGVEADGGSNPKPRFETILSVFSLDDTQTTVRLTALKSDGTVLGFHDLVLNQPGGGGHFQPRSLNIPELNAVINEPVTIKVDVLSGGRVGAYALIRDVVTRDPTYVQAVPQN